MVFCGKPSRACTECRLRRTKCDTLKPSCSQCRRAGRVCRGYRDPSDLRFRDESQGLRSKRERQSEPKKSSHTSKVASSSVVGAKSPPPKSTDAIGSTTTLQDPNRSLLSFHLGTPTDDQSICFFFRNFVLEDYKYGSFDLQCLRYIYANEEVGTALSQCIVSLGMVGLSHFWGAKGLLPLAQAKYNSTLRLVSSLLRNIEDAKSDQTLIVVMLLALYEISTCTGHQSMKTWMKHINGAVALLNLRGVQQLKTAVGYQLFVHLRTQVIANCLQRNAPIPSFIRKWSKAALEFETPEQAAVTALSDLSIKYSDIRSSMSTFKDYSNSETIIPALISLDAEYADWTSTCPPRFVYSTVNLTKRSNDVFSDHYHVYTSVGATKVWNNYRGVRILVNELLVDQLNHLLKLRKSSLPARNNTPGRLETQILASNSIIIQLSHDICASVPYCLGYEDTLDPASREPPKAGSAVLLLWPLYTASMTSLVSPMMRDWIAARLVLIAEVVGIKQAMLLAQALRAAKNIVHWQKNDSSDN